MRVLYNMKDKRVIASGLRGDLSVIVSALAANDSWLSIIDRDVDLKDSEYLIRVANDCTSDHVTFWVFAEHSMLNKKEWTEFDRCLNVASADCEFQQVRKSDVSSKFME